MHELQRVYSAASLSNDGDAPGLLANPEFLVFDGDGIAEERTRVAVDAAGEGHRVLGFATVRPDQDGVLELEDLFVDPACRRLGIARRLVLDAVNSARESGHDHLFVIANPHAHAFYTSVGFIEVGQAKTELGVGRRMRLDIGTS